VEQTPIETEKLSRTSEGTQSIRRAIQVLHAVAAHKDMRLTQISNEVGLHVATTRRILVSLVDMGFLQTSGNHSTYSLGPMVLHLGQVARDQNVIIEPFRSRLEEIAKRSGDTVLLSVRSQNDAVCVLRVEGAFPIRTMIIDVGSIRPLGAGAGSLALLAWLPDQQVERIITLHASAYPKLSIQAEQVRNLVKQSRKLGYALNDGLMLKGISGLGIPISDTAGNIVAAISITAISSRMKEPRARELVAMVRQVCKDIPFWTLLNQEQLNFKYRHSN
jgi:DNA-binding IclR family transcriptional regulator